MEAKVKPLSSLLGIFALLMLIGPGTFAQAQDGQGEADHDKNASQESLVGEDCQPTNAEQAPLVKSVRRVDGKSEPVQLGDAIELEIAHLPTLLEQQTCWQEHQGEDQIVVLFLDGRALSNVGPASDFVPGTSKLQFDLRHSDASRDVWTHVLGRPRFEPRSVEVSVGIAGRFAIPSGATIQLEPLPVGQVLLWLALFAVLVVIFWKLARMSTILRDPIAMPEAGKKPSYSLARTQAAWWFFLILASYLFLGIVTGDFSSSITGTAVVLLGLAYGTVLASSAVDSNSDTEEARQADEAAIGKLEAEIEKLGQELSQADGDSDAKAKIAAKKIKIGRIRSENTHFLTDILSDVNGVSLGRFQHVGWTLVLGVVFVWEVYRDLAMPQFSETLLGLMGISAGTYVGTKIPTHATQPRPDGSN